LKNNVEGMSSILLSIPRFDVMSGGSVIFERGRHRAMSIFWGRECFLCFRCYSTYPTVVGGVTKRAKSAHLIPSISMHDDRLIIGSKLKSDI
jgi:hypothetical protein